MKYFFKTYLSIKYSNIKKYFITQEFCLFAVVGLLTDFFLQLVFFATFLSVDIRRLEVRFLLKILV